MTKPASGRCGEFKAAHVALWREIDGAARGAGYLRRGYFGDVTHETTRRARRAWEQYRKVIDAPATVAEEKCEHGVLWSMECLLCGHSDFEAAPTPVQPPAAPQDVLHDCGDPDCDGCDYEQKFGERFFPPVEATQVEAIRAEIGKWVERRRIQNVAQTEIDALAKRLARLTNTQQQEGE